MPHDINPVIVSLALEELRKRIEEQCEQIPTSLFAFNRNGLRMAIAAIEDETTELYDEWQHHKRMLGNAHEEIKHELLDIAAIAIIAYTEAMGKR